MFENTMDLTLVDTYPIIAWAVVMILVMVYFGMI